MEDLQISPSDFGFHNALRTNTGPVFFDFEFSGWDDPAKTIIDFFFSLVFQLVIFILIVFEKVLLYNLLTIKSWIE